MSQSGQKQKKSKVESFIWTDDEVELLLKVTMEYKAAKTMENVDWESCQTKYSDILNLFLEQYPSPENASSIGKEYPHKQGELSKPTLTSKLKTIRTKFRQAVDSGRSGHGRVVLLYFEICEGIWGGSPATSTIPSGIETTEIEDVNSNGNSQSPGSPESSSESISTFEIDEDSPDQATSDSPESTEQASIASKEQVKERRDLLNAKLRGYKSEKLKRKLPVDTQLLNVSQEELQIKRQLLERMDNMDKAHFSHMEKLTSNMEKLTGSISEGFAMLRQIMCQAPGMQPHYMAPQASYNMYNMHETPQRNIESNSRNPNIGQFSYTQSLFSNDDNNY